MSLRSSAQPARQASWVMGGIHMTGNSFVPASLLKVTPILILKLLVKLVTMFNVHVRISQQQNI